MPRTKTNRKRRLATDAANKNVPAFTPHDRDEAVGVLAPDGHVLIGALKTGNAAKYLSVSVPTVRRVVERGLLIPNRVSRHLLFSIKELDRFLKEGMVE
jgi:excisionase family DNA binding protein